ncbi:hypothetical protein BDV29DRAFT_181698 [Aspergillus leporis]|uniref:Uncharacterized protein n=1 Tax=Aspergillus leporis TaxID=41062 RepID=A0A5N5WSC7_9EURO|nr:hypothetical protein BDV29DRAFT_181698 [Aspergillus leporis]
MAVQYSHSRPPSYKSVGLSSRVEITNSDSEPGSESERCPPDAGSAVDAFLHAHPQPAIRAAAPPRLPYPVVIPQRRPGNKERGFVKAYAPALEQYGISHDAFLDLIRACNKAIQASKWLVAIQVAAAGTGFIPNNIAIGVSMAVQVIAGVIAQAEIKWKTNLFLEQVNNEFFRPRGLCCLLMAYNPVAADKKEKVDDTQIVSKLVPPSSGRGLSARAKRNLRDPVAGTAEGEENLPATVAPLVYPDYYVKNRSPGEQEKKRNKITRLNDYFDRRAQARYATESKEDVLSTPSQPFKNRYLDPNHPANNGGLLGLLSGGHLTPNPEKTKERMQTALATQEKAVREQQTLGMARLHQQLQMMNLSLEQQRDYVQKYQDAYDLQLQQIQQQAEWVTQGQRRITQNILYLMIVNMPSEAEMAAAREQLNVMCQGQPVNNMTVTAVNV